MLEIALLIVGIVIGGICTGLLVGSRLRQKHSQEILQIQAEHNSLLNDAEGRIKATEASRVIMLTF